MTMNRVETIVEQSKLNKLKDEGKIIQGEVVVDGNNYKYKFTSRLFCGNYANIRSLENVVVEVEFEKEGSKMILLNHKVMSKEGFHVLPGQVPVMVSLVCGYDMGDANILSVPLVARVLNCSEKFVHGLIQNGDLNADPTLHEVLEFKKRNDQARQQAFQDYLEETNNLGID